MRFEDSFFQEEIRDGFCISALMKRCWAAQLEVLEQFDMVCKKIGLRYFAAYGTLLGAVRSRGFIPWDDDIDIWMLREDVETLIDKGISILKEEGLELVASRFDPSYRNMVIRINNTEVFSLEESFLMRYHLFPFTAGLDIFPLDSIPDDKSSLENMKKNIGTAVALEKQWNNESIPMEEKMEQYRQLVEGLEDNSGLEDDIQRNLWKLIDHYSAMYEKRNTKQVAMLTYFFENERKVFDRKNFEKTVFLDFEGFQMPCPFDSRHILEIEFGEDYMIPKRVDGDHEYPYYRSRQELLKKFLNSKGIPCPSIYENSTT